MTNQAAIQFLRILREGETRPLMQEALFMAIEALQKQENWIPVYKALPGNSTSRKVTYEVNGERRVGVAYYSRYCQKWCCPVVDSFKFFEDDDCKIIAWQPDPEPFRK